MQVLEWDLQVPISRQIGKVEASTQLGGFPVNQELATNTRESWAVARSSLATVAAVRHQ
jgi:hypothetical protein